MTKIDIISGFLGAGKTTLIKKLIKEELHNEKLVLIENEFGEIGIDGGFLKDAGIEIREMNAGCICCSLVGDFAQALIKVMEEYAPERIIIEPSGVGKLSDVLQAVQSLQKEHDLTIHSLTTVVDALKCRMYMKNFGEFFNNQIETAKTIVLSRTQKLTDEKLHAVVRELKHHNVNATLITTPWDKLSGKTILEAMEVQNLLEKELLAAHQSCPVCEHQEHDHEDACTCGHDHHEHEEHHHEDACTCGHDHHEHEEHHHEEACTCGHDHHEHEGHHHHHADEVFTSWGQETPRKYTHEELEHIVKTLSDTETYGTVLRAKGMLESEQGTWLYFDFVPQEYEIRHGEASYTGRFCVIGAALQEEELKKLFQLA